MSVTYTTELPLGEHTVDRLETLLAAERDRRGTRAGRRALDCRAQAVLVLRWFVDSTRGGPARPRQPDRPVDGL
ncbi:hypothetical protein FRAHR75_680034 [Frankia sp. Hr75.2]|nr:hypothetical protein FRAHR75_680034 [Frankia sp. Hr75.2]